MATPGQAVALVIRAVVRGIAESTWNGKRTQVDEVRGCAAVDDRANLIGAIEALARAGIVAFEVVVEVEWLPVLQVKHAVKPPTVLQAAIGSSERGKHVGEVPGEPAANIEIGITVFSCRVQTVVGLGGIGDEVFQVTGIVKRVRPDEIGLARQPMP